MGGLSRPLLVAEVDFRTAYAAVVEVGGQPRGRHVHQHLYLTGHISPIALDDDTDVHDGVLLVVGLEDRLVGELLQWGAGLSGSPATTKYSATLLSSIGGFSV